MDTRRSILTQLAGRPMSLADLAGATGASLPTLRRAVQELTSARWIRVVGREEATGGRPANLFGLDDDVLTLVGVHLAHPGMRLVATDLTGRVLDDVVPPELYDLEPDAVHQAVLAFLADLRRRRPHRRVVGLGIATPGFIDRATGTVVTIGRVPNWNNLPLAERLREATGLHVTIGNDLDALATAEFGLGEEARTYAYVGYAGFYDDGPNANWVEGGLTFLANPDTQLDVNTGLRVDDNGNDFFLGVGVAHRF